MTCIQLQPNSIKWQTVMVGKEVCVEFERDQWIHGCKAWTQIDGKSVIALVPMEWLMRGNRPVLADDKLVFEVVEYGEEER